MSSSSSAVVEFQPASTTKPSAAKPGGLSEVFWLALPVVMQTLAETVMNVIDSAFVGRLGTTALGAFGFASIWVWTLLVPIAGVTMGVQAFVSRHDGAREPEQCGRWVWQALWLMVPLMLVLAVALVAGLPALFGAIGAEPQLRELAVAYGVARLWGAPAIVVEFAVSSFFRGIGDTRTPLLAACVGVLVDVLAAFTLVFGMWGMPQLGIVGAGYAQSAGSYAIAAVLLWALLTRRVRERYATAPVWPEPAAVLRFLRTSAPIGGQWLLDMASFAIFTSAVACMGSVAMAASQALLQLLALSFMQASALGTAAGTLVGRYLGARDLEAAARSFRSAQLLALGLGLGIAVLFVGAPQLLIGLFVHDAEVIALARPLLSLGALFQVLDAIGIVAAGSLRGAGDTRWPFLVQATLAWALRLPMVYLFAVVLRRGVFGAWSGELVYIGVLGLMLVLRFRAGHWQKVQI
jgi:MATE family multidrug resistance protein